MKRLIPAGLVAFIISALVFVFPATTNGQGAGLVSSVLSRMEKNRQTLKTLRAGITMVKYNSQLGVEDKYNGVVIYMPTGGRQAAVRIDWSSPRRRSGWRCGSAAAAQKAPGSHGRTWAPISRS